MAEFKDMLKYFRNREGLSQAQLAKALGLSASAISMYEVGSREPDFETEEKIADFFNTDLNTLRGRDNEAAFYPTTDNEFQAFNTGTILGMAAKDPDQIKLLGNYQSLDDDNRGKLLQFSEALTLLP